MGFFDKVKNAIGGAAKQAQDAVQQQVQPQQQQQQAAPPPPAPLEHHEEEVAQDDDDGERRDYALEAKDDQAGFDLAGDLPGWYVAEFRIEQAWEDEAQRAQLFAEYGVRNVQHYRQVKATVDRFIQTPQAQAKYGDINDIMHVKMKATQDFMMAGMNAQMGAGGKLAGE